MFFNLVLSLCALASTSVLFVETSESQEVTLSPFSPHKNLLEKIFLSESWKIDPQFISLFVADQFAPKEYDGATKKDANDALKQIFKLSEARLLEFFPEQKEAYDGILATLDKVGKFSRFSVEPWNKYKNIGTSEEKLL